MQRAEQIEALYRRHGRELWARAYARCCDAQLAMDAVQEAFLRLHQSTEPVADPLAWVWRVLANWMTDSQRRSSRQRSLADLPEPTDPQCDPADALVGQERGQQLREALSQLDPADREILALRYAANARSEEIARILETTASAVDMRLSRARRRLGETLRAMGVGHETLR